MRTACGNAGVMTRDYQAFPPPFPVVISGSGLGKPSYKARMILPVGQVRTVRSTHTKGQRRTVARLGLALRLGVFVLIERMRRRVRFRRQVALGRRALFPIAARVGPLLPSQGALSHYELSPPSFLPVQCEGRDAALRREPDIALP
jgi:hypothetical protein